MKMDPCRNGMVVCRGTHHFGQELLGQGNATQPMPPKYVNPNLKCWKSDTKDAEACAEACLRPTRFVAVKGEVQLATQSLDRHRSRLVRNFRQLVN